MKLLHAGLKDLTDLGFQFQENDDHVVDIFLKDTRVARLNQRTARIGIIRKTCYDLMRALNFWIYTRKGKRRQ